VRRAHAGGVLCACGDVEDPAETGEVNAKRAVVLEVEAAMAESMAMWTIAR